MIKKIIGSNEEIEKNISAPKVYIFSSEVSVIKQEAEKYPNCETGGDLFGLLTHGNMLVIWFVSLPGPNAVLQNTYFTQDVEYLNKLQNQLNNCYGIQYLGTWHSHHTLNLHEPSQGDIKSMQNYALKHKRRIGLEIIVSLNNLGNATLAPFYYRDAKTALRSGWEKAEIIVLPKYSPIRQVLTLDLECSSVVQKVMGSISELPNVLEEALNNLYLRYSKIELEYNYYGDDLWQITMYTPQKGVKVAIMLKVYNRNIVVQNLFLLRGQKIDNPNLIDLPRTLKDEQESSDFLKMIHDMILS